MRVLLVDDHEVVRRGVRSLLLGQKKYEICGEAVDGQDALEKARALKPDVIIMDVSMPNLNGLEATRQVRGWLPDCEVLILSQHESPEMVRQAINAGARGFVAKRSIGKDLISALESVARHEPFFDSAVLKSVNPSGNLDVQEILQRSAAFERALRESEQLYRSTFELAAVGVAHVSPEGRWLRVNKKLCDIVGYSESELLKLTFQQITHPDDLPADLAETAKIVSGELDTFSMEKRYIRKDGSQVWINLSVAGARDASGKLKHFISVVEDISERREAHDARSRLAAIVESSDDAIVSKDLNGIIKSWNPGAARMFGFTAEEAVGHSITIIIPPELHDEEKQILRRLRKGEHIEHYETVRKTKSGTRLNVSLTISPVRNSKGQVIGASKIARDITARKQVEEELRESQTQLELALESSRTAIFDWDVIENRGKWNPQMAVIYGFNPEEEEITAEQWRRLFHPDDVPRLTEEARQAYRDKQKDKFQFEFRAIRPDGSVRYMLSHGRIIRDASGRAVRLIGTHTDITDRKQAEEVERVRELSGLLLRSQDEERRRFARELHDSAGQTLAILGVNLAKLIEQAEGVAPDVASEGVKIQELVQQLQREIRTTSYLLHPPLLDEAGLSSALSWYVEGLVERSGLELNLAMAEDFGRLPADMEMTIFRLVQECLTNVHRHSGSKSADIRIAREGESVSVEVKDQGEGMSPSRLAEIQTRGSGVGLRGIRERLRQFHGEMSIQSNGSGTRVLVRIPIPKVDRSTGVESVEAAVNESFPARVVSGLWPDLAGQRPATTHTSHHTASFSALVQHSNCFEDGVAYDFQALGAELVHGVLRGVMEDVVVAIRHVNDIGAGDAAFHEGNVIVFFAALKGIEMRLVAAALGSGVDQVEQPGSGVGVAQNGNIDGSDHIHDHERLDFFQCPVFLPFFGKMTRAVQAVGVRPILYSFLAIGPDQPDAVAVAGFARGNP